MQQFGYTNPMEVPKLTKITINMGVGGRDQQEGAGERRRRHGQDHRPEAGGDQVARVGRFVQDPRRLPIGCVKVTCVAPRCSSSSTA